MTDHAAARLRAKPWMDQLRVEIKGSRFRSIRRFTDDLGTEYYTFRRYLASEREMPFPVMLSCLTALDLTFADLERRVHAGEA